LNREEAPRIEEAARRIKEAVRRIEAAAAKWIETADRRMEEKT
jgi:hypothetical protein